MGIREFQAEDIPRVAELHREAMQSAPHMTESLLARYRQWLTSTFLANPMRMTGLESLVYDDGGEIVGFLGVVPRQVKVGDTVYRGSAASNFCIKAGRRGPLGLQMARQYLARSGDLVFIDELTDSTRLLWDRLGLVAMPQSVRWTLPLRPTQHVLALISEHVPRPFAAIAKPAMAALDGAAAVIPRSPFRYGKISAVVEELSPTTLAQLLMEFGDRNYLRPLTTDGSAAWLVERARSMSKHGRLHMIALRDTNGVAVGWYVYYAKRGGLGEVMQLVATPARAREVLGHLAAHARREGVVSLTGTLDPTFLTPLSELWAVIAPSPMATRWVLVHSKRPEILEAFWRNKVLLSRLDGEWFQHFE